MASSQFLYCNMNTVYELKIVDLMPELLFA